MPDEQVVLFGETNFRNQRRRFGIKVDDRRRHMYVIGKTGMGKTTLLENMVIRDIQEGRGVALIDPHGEFAEKILDFIPSKRVNDVIYFNPADGDNPIAFNVMEQVDAEYRPIIADGLVEVFHKLWAESWGPRLEYLLRNAILALLEHPGATLLGIMRILVNKEYRQKVLESVTDPVVKSFWVDEFARYPQQFQVEAVAPIQNKVGQFLTSPIIRNVVGQTKTAMNLRESMDQGKILIINLAKGRIGEGSSRLLGAMMITKLQLAAMSRINVPEPERRDFYLYVDEFQNFATVSFINILSEARKYRLNLVLAHQYLEQLDEDVRPAVLGNVGTLVLFRIGALDAELFEKEFEPEFFGQDLVNLSKYNVYLKLMIDGVASRAFSASTLPPYTPPERSNRETVIRISRERYATPRAVVEEKINRWSQILDEEKKGEEKKMGGQKKREEKRSMWDAVCSVCGQKTQVPFEPDGTRPVYCQTCLSEIRQGVREPLSSRKSPQPAAVGISRPSKGAAVTREVGSAMSLEALAPKEEQVAQREEAVPVSEERPKKKRKEVDLGELRDALDEALKAEEE